MDMLWSGLARRASEFTRVERKSQFNGIHEIALKSVNEHKSKDNVIRA